MVDLSVPNVPEHIRPEDWYKLVVMMLRQNGGSMDISEQIRSQTNPAEWFVVWCRNPATWSWKLRAYRDDPKANADEIRTAVDALRARYEEQDDSEVAHSSEDGIRDTALRAIAAGVPGAAEIAAEALKTSEIEFSRHTA